jgi:hypothetical protein
VGRSNLIAVGFGLNRALHNALFVDAEHRCMVWGTQIETDDVGGLGFKLRIVACHIIVPDGAVSDQPPSRHDVRRLY